MATISTDVSVRMSGNANSATHTYLSFLNA